MPAPTCKHSIYTLWWSQRSNEFELVCCQHCSDRYTTCNNNNNNNMQQQQHATTTTCKSVQNSNRVAMAVMRYIHASPSTTLVLASGAASNKFEQLLSISYGATSTIYSNTNNKSTSEISTNSRSIDRSCVCHSTKFTNDRCNLLFGEHSLTHSLSIVAPCIN
jgi:hypothetical protein